MRAVPFAFFSRDKLGRRDEPAATPSSSKPSPTACGGQHKQQAAPPSQEEDGAGCSPPQHLSYIPVFSSRAQFVQHQGPSEACCSAGVVKAEQQHSIQTEGGPAAAGEDDVSAALHQLGLASEADIQCHSLQLALEHSSADWQPHPLDTLVAVIGAQPAWLRDSTASLAIWSSSLPQQSEQRTEQRQDLVPASSAAAAPAAATVCIAVSSVSSKLDSLAIVPLRPLPSPASPSQLSDSRHLGEF